MDRQRGSVAEVWRAKMIEPKPGILGTTRAYRETVADERTGTEYDAWDSQVMQAMRDIGAKEGSAASGLMRVAVDVCDSLLVASVIHSRFPQAADRKISFADIFEQVSIGVREQNKDDSKEMLKDEIILRLAESMGIDERSAQ